MSSRLSCPDFSPCGASTACKSSCSPVPSGSETISSGVISDKADTTASGSDSGSETDSAVETRSVFCSGFTTELSVETGAVFMTGADGLTALLAFASFSFV